MGDTDVPSFVPGVMLRVNEVYDRPTVQGEGPHVGRLCTFVRLWGCNLHCRWCDTPYTWDTTGKNGTVFARSEQSRPMMVADVAEAVAALHVPICVVSGGEPMLQQGAVLELARQLLDYDVETHVETNGTRPPPDDDTVIAHWSVSPKLPSADAGAHALVFPVLRQWAQHPRAIFKVVCFNPADVDEARHLFDMLRVPQHARWVMPEGITADAVDASLHAVVDAALAHHLNITPRLHVQLWGATRGR